MNILDVVKVKYPKSDVVLSVSEYNTLNKDMIELKKLIYVSKILLKDGVDLESDIAKRLISTNYEFINAYNTKRKKYYDTHKGLGDKYMYKVIQTMDVLPTRYSNKVINSLDFKLIQDELTIDSTLPSATLGDLKSICEKFNFIMIPFSYFNGDFFNKNSEIDPVTKKNVLKAMDSIPTGKTGYVMCPLEYYSISKHVESNTNLSIYTGKNIIILGGVLLQIPLLQSFNNRMSDIEQNVNIIKTQVNSISMQLNEIKKQQILQELDLKNITLNNTQRNILPKDPLLFTIPNGVDINDVTIDDTACKLLYSWGPDFTDEVVTALGAVSIDGNRTEIEQRIRNIFG